MANPDPFAQFAEWFDAAALVEPNDPNAMALATAAVGGQPSLRVVLLKAWDRHGFVFYTNLGSRKGLELSANPLCAVDFHWKSQRRQVRIEGRAEAVTATEADAYFASRPRDSQLGAWASEQSRPLADRATFDARFASATTRFAGGEVPRPPHWSGWRIVPQVIEFWQDREYRLHERTVYTHAADGWTTGMLFP